MSLPTSTGTLGLTEEHRDLRDSVRAFVKRHVTETVVRDAVEAKAEELPAFWLVLAGEGLLSLHLPEEHGGAGATLLETAVVLEELGRAMAPGPLLPTVVASAVLHHAAHSALLAGPRGRYDASGDRPRGRHPDRQARRRRQPRRPR